MYYVYVIHNSHHVKPSGFCEHFSFLPRIAIYIAGCWMIINCSCYLQQPQLQMFCVLCDVAACHTLASCSVAAHKLLVYVARTDRT